jgi:aspartate racemase
MKKIGIIGGLGPESTILYYRQLIVKYQERDNRNTPVILIYSINLSEFFRCQELGDHAFQQSMLKKGVESLTAAGVDLIAIAANTPHMFFEEVAKDAKVPLISIVEETAKETLAYSASKRAGLLGTKFTMEGSFYPDVFKKYGIEVFVPERADLQIVNTIIYNELVKGIVHEHSRKKIYSIIDRMAEAYSIDTLILGCTELPLILEGEHNGIIMLDTVRIHVRSIINRCFEN